MTALPPPTYYFNGITFNSAFYPQTSTTTSSSGDGITEAEANLLYLRKTTADTATALETFTAGISTPSVNTSGNLLIGGNASTLGVSIGQATTTTAILGNESVKGNIVMNGTASTNYLQFPDGTQQFTAAAVSGNFVNFPTAQGALSIPSASITTTLGVTGNTTLSNLSVSGSETVTGNVIMNGTALTNYIQFPDGTKQYTAGGGAAGNYVNYPTAQGALTIPSATITTTLGVSGLLTASGNLNTNSIDAIGNGISICPSKNITFGALGTTNSIQIGASNRTVAISVGSVVIGADSITGLSTTTNFKICDTLVEGNISIGELQQGGKINIGTFSGRLATGEINIFTILK